MDRAIKRGRHAAPRSVSRRVVACGMSLVVSAVGLSTTGSPAAANELGTAIEALPVGTNWVVYPSSATPVQDGRLQLVELARAADGSCEVDLTLTLAPDADAIAAHERAFNAATCQSVFEVGSPVGNETDESSASAADVVEAPDAGAGAAPESPSDLLGVTDNHGTRVTSAGYYKSYYEDPAQIDVNSVRNDVTWTWRKDKTGCVNWIDSAYAYGWYDASGWELRGNNFSNQTKCESHEASSYAEFFNGAFCLNFDTRTFYNRNRVRGMKTGLLVGEVRASKQGGCVGFLSFHTTLRRTQN
jgi:hypothetical protein